MVIATKVENVFKQTVEAALDRLTPAEPRVARFFLDRKHDALLNSAAEIAEMVGAAMPRWCGQLVRSVLTAWPLCVKRCLSS